MTQWKRIPIVVVTALTVCCGYAFAQTGQSPSRRGEATQVPPRMEQAINMMFQKMDTNHDGKISKSEWMAFQEKQFKQLDKNGNGFITKNEVRDRMMENMRRAQEQMRRRGPSQ